MSQEGNGRGNAHHGFADKGEDNKEDDGLGIEVQRIDLVMREHCIEEIGEGRNQACPESVKMDGDLGGHPVNRNAGSRLGHRRPPLIGISSER